MGVPTMECPQKHSDGASSDSKESSSQCQGEQSIVVGKSESAAGNPLNRGKEGVSYLGMFAARESG